MNSDNNRRRLQCLDGLKGIGAFIIAFFGIISTFLNLQLSLFIDYFLFK